MSSTPGQVFITSGSSYNATDTNIYIGWNSPDPSDKTTTIPASTGALTTIVVQDFYGNSDAHPITVAPVTGSITGPSVLANSNASITLLDTTSGWASI